MSTRQMLSVVLKNDDSDDELTVEYDASSAGTSSEVDFREDGGTLVITCALADVRSFAESLLAFVEFHEPDE